MEQLDAKEDDEDRQSSSLSVTDDSDPASSQESDDSLELSESESITDVTPLNSPYCDSPLPHVRSSDLQASQGEDASNINVLTQAIKRLEVEQKEKLKKQSSAASNCKKKQDSSRRRADPDSQRLLKHVVSQQSRAKSTSSHDRLHRRSTVINRHKLLNSSEISTPVEKTHSGRLMKSSQKHVRQIKCLSHPSPYSLGMLGDQASCSQEQQIADQDKASSHPPKE